MKSQNKILKGKKIVILVISDFLSDARVQKEARSAHKAGMKVVVLTKKTPKTKYREIKDGIRIIRVETFLDRWLLPFYHRLSKNVQSNGSVAIKEHRKMTFLEALAIVLNVFLLNRIFVKEALKIKPDLVHANDPITLPAGYKIKKMLAAKLIYDSHELYSEMLKHPHPVWQKTFIWVEKKINWVDGILSVSHWVLKELNKRYQTAHILQAVVLNAPVYEKSQFQRPRRPVRMLYLGAIDYQRGVIEFAKKIQNLKNIDFAIISKTDLTNLGIKSLPAVNPEGVIRAMKNYDVGIIPFVDCSSSVYNSLPNKLFDYMMAGLAIAASNLPEINQFIKKENNGVIFNPKNSRDVRLKIKYLADNPKIIAGFKRNSLKAAKEYSWENQAVKQLGIYEKVLS